MNGEALDRDEALRRLAAGVSLAQTVLANLDLRGVQVRGADLRGALLRARRFRRQPFRGCRLSRGDVPAVPVRRRRVSRTGQLEGSGFQSCSGAGAKFERSNLSDSRFVQCQFPAAGFAVANCAAARSWKRTCLRWISRRPTCVAPW